jgi:cyclohexanecarboxylate-CoA ligase
MPDLTQGVAYPPANVDRYLAEGHWTDETPQQWLADWADQQPDAPAIIAPGRRLTYAELYEQARRVAAGLIDLGLTPGDAVGIQLPNISEFLIAYHGVQMMGGVLTLLHMPYRAGELAPLLNHGGVKAVICHGALPSYDAPATMAGLRGQVASLDHIIISGDGPAGTTSFSDLERATPRDLPPPATADPAVLAFTSGTSSAPKAVVHPYRTMACNHKIYATAFGIRADDVVLSAPPFSHIYGLCVANIILRAGAANALMAAYTPEAFAGAIGEARVSMAFCGPAHMLAAIKGGQMTLEVGASLRSIIFAGSACPPGLIVEAEGICANATGHQMFGMTETLMQTATPVDAGADVRHRSIGVANAAHEMRVIGDDGAPLLPGEEGELQFRGPTLFAGYFNNPEATREALQPDGWFHTGDLAEIDADGNVVMTGRVKDIINRGGIKINPIDLEALVDAHPAVLISAIAPMPDEIMGEKACLFVQLQPDQSLSLEEVLAWLSERKVAKLKWPERLEVVGDMPMTPTRKVMKGALVADLQRRDAGPE